MNNPISSCIASHYVALRISCICPRVRSPWDVDWSALAIDYESTVIRFLPIKRTVPSYHASLWIDAAEKCVVRPRAIYGLKYTLD